MTTVPINRLLDEPAAVLSRLHLRRHYPAQWCLKQLYLPRENRHGPRRTPCRSTRTLVPKCLVPIPLPQNRPMAACCVLRGGL